jgi:hypothetical protein
MVRLANGDTAFDAEAEHCLSLSVVSDLRLAPKRPERLRQDLKGLFRSWPGFEAHVTRNVGFGFRVVGTFEERGQPFEICEWATNRIRADTNNISRSRQCQEKRLDRKLLAELDYAMESYEVCVPDPEEAEPFLAKFRQVAEALRVDFKRREIAGDNHRIDAHVRLADTENTLSVYRQ